VRTTNPSASACTTLASKRRVTRRPSLREVRVVLKVKEAAAEFLANCRQSLTKAEVRAMAHALETPTGTHNIAEGQATRGRWTKTVQHRRVRCCARTVDCVRCSAAVQPWQLDTAYASFRPVPLPVQAAEVVLLLPWVLALATSRTSLSDRSLGVPLWSTRARTAPGAISGDGLALPP
jgi:hypothetical protein